ncbi:GTPase domain-containing protein [Georgenia sp. M64]|uniref:GTPase domain-containing protein n=1 Tax=Georgenia sp. M64 TaxID=3120520 RepID=UPI0030DF589C
MTTDAPDSALRAPRLDVVTDLRAEIERAAFPLDLPGAAGLRALREQLLTQIDARLLPRLARTAGPAVVVLGGSSGAGKSSLLNAVVGREISEAGVLRPTTRRAVLAVHPDDVAALSGGPLERLADVVVDEGVPRGLALLDAPDLDSVHPHNRSLSAQLLETADLWVFTTTASRYGDAAAWHQLTAAHERGITTAVVLNRVPGRVLAPVRADLLARMDDLGLGSAPLFVVPDAGALDGPLPDGLAEELGAWLRLVAASHQGEGLAGRTTRGVWAALREQLLDLAVGLDDQVEAADALRAAVHHAAQGPAEGVADALRAGRAGAGAPTTRWLSLASTGGPLAPLVDPRLRPGRRGGAAAARSAAAAGLGDEVGAALEVVVADAVATATDAVRRAWHGRELGAEQVGVEVPADRSHEVVARWRADVRAVVTAPAGVLDDDGIAGLVQAGAAGVAGAAEAAAALAGAEAVPRARESLAEAAAEAVRSVVQPFLDAVDELPVTSGTGLRLRASELKEHA